MIKYEIKKLWKTPIIWFVLLATLLFHIGTIIIDANIVKQSETASYYEKYQGQINDTWIQNIQSAYHDYIMQPSHRYTHKELLDQGITEEKIKRLSDDDFTYIKSEVKQDPEFQVLSQAYNASYFKASLDEDIAFFKNMYRINDSDFDVSKIDKDYAKLSENYQKFEFTSIDSYAILQKGITIMIRTFTIFLSVLLSTIFTREQNDGVLELQLVCKKMEKVKYAKWSAAFLSTIISWAIFIVLQILFIAMTLGFHGENGYVIDFTFNHCPYMLNALQYTLLQSFISLLGSLVIAFCMIAISYLAKKNSTAVILSMVLFVMVPFLNNAGIFKELLYYYPANFIGGDYLLAAVHYTKIAGIYFHGRWLAIISGLLYLTCTSLCLILKKHQHYVIDWKSLKE